MTLIHSFLAQINPPPAVDPVSLVERSIQWIGACVLFLVDRVLTGVGIDTTTIPGGELTLAAIGFGLLLPISAFLSWTLRKLVMHRIRRDRCQRGLTAVILNCGLRPVLMLLWVYAGLIALSPMLGMAVANTEDSIIIPAVRAILIVSAIASVSWFVSKLIRHWEKVLRQWQPGEGQTAMDRPLLAPLILRSARFCVPVAAVLLAMRWMFETDARFAWPAQMGGILIILAMAWVLSQMIQSFPQFILRKYDLDASDNLDARKIFTQVKVIQRISFVVLGFFTLSAIILLFPAIRQFGQAILASAGVAGIILGFALQRALGNLFAGIQIAFTQPIRIDDVVIVENEWGWIEDITLTYVVVKIWDWRRLVLPISYFIEHPFQNWTRTSASIIGTVFMKADYRLPIQPVREAVQAQVEAHPLWDRKVYCLQVTDCADQTVEIRVLVSAVDSPKAWDLRCDIRESMLTYVQTEFPECLPRLRIEATGPPKRPVVEPSKSMVEGQTPIGHHLEAGEISRTEMAKPMRETSKNS